MKNENMVDHTALFRALQSHADSQREKLWQSMLAADRANDKVRNEVFDVNAEGKNEIK